MTQASIGMRAGAQAHDERVAAAEAAFFGSEVDLSKPPLLPPSVAQLIARNPDIQTLNAVALKLVRVLDDPNSSASTVESALRADVGLASRIMRTANSSLYGAASGAGSVRQAVARIGFESVRAIALAAAMSDGNQLTSTTATMLARHSVAVAVLSRLLAYQQKKADADLCFVAGLLHDIGKFMLLQSLGDDYEDVAVAAAAVGWNFCELERALIGADHAEVGASLAYGWGLHPRILMAIRLHHQLGTMYTAELDPLTVCLVATVRLADDMFRAERDPDGDLAVEFRPVQSEARDMLELDDAVLKQVWTDFHTHYNEACLVLL
ncbi:MAG: putative nucleotidyltransferase with HDIG domain [Myxococcota bacterium]|jgi:putative nucleotidyltransferase with HDIG domain